MACVSGTSGVGVLGKPAYVYSFGAEQPSYEQYPSTWKVEPYDNPGQRKPNTYVSFVFRYRSPGM